ncbi:MAG: CsiV family protein [Wenzhouxiangella sp.]|jgi:hypothetical protein|nr:CsiV family protein [Wenzhouxiangella sp.]
MKRVFWLLLVSSLIGSGPGWAEDSDRVLVEVVVFQHVNGQSDRWPMPVADQFADLPDPLTRADVMMVNAPAVPRTEQRSTGDPHGPSWPPLYTHTGQHSEVFQRALSRIQSSRDYLILSNLSWIQPLARNTRPQAVRIRGNEELRLDDEPAPPPRLIFGRAIDGGPGPEANPYQLDGSITVRQRQFRHVDLDLVWQEPQLWLGPSGPLSPVAQGEPEVLTHRLQTSRPIGLDRLEYFDSPWLGVIVLVQEWSRPDLSDAGANVSQPVP